jgi:hypothetical protein
MPRGPETQCRHQAGAHVSCWERLHVGPRWRVTHAFGTSLPGWLVVLPRRHVTALDQLTAGEAADLGPLLRALTAALREVLGCSKTYMDEVAISVGQALRLE